MNFPADIKGCMRECILNLLWARRDIFAFFESNGCTKKDIEVIENFKEKGLSRAQMIDEIFAKLSTRTDKGLGPFRAMLSSLLKWSHFDPYYFDTLGKLNIDTAHRSLQHLRQVQEIRDAKIKEDRKRREIREEEIQKPAKTLDELRELYMKLITGKGSTQRRGYELEYILQELSKLSSLEITQPFRINGEQIDGSIKFDGEHYIIEAKWHDREASNEPVYQFVGKVEGKMYGRGIFISVNGFSPLVVKSVVDGKAIKTIFIDGEDLVLVLDRHLSFTQLLDKKIRAAQTKGIIYIQPITGKAKI